jgi:DNA invertase Pin-like site-specific DNA recombinase
MTVYAYYRVSSEKQDYESQKIGVIEYCNRCGYKIDKEVVDDGVSGVVKAKDRNLWKIIKSAQAGDWLITSEISRLGRSTSDVLNTCDILNKKGVNVWFIKQGMGLDQTPMGKMMIAILSAFAEMERDLIRQRTIEGLARVKAKGVHLGRPFGFGPRKLDKHYDELVQMLKAGMSKAEICRCFKVEWKTLHYYMQTKGLKYEKKHRSI